METNDKMDFDELRDHRTNTFCRPESKLSMKLISMTWKPSQISEALSYGSYDMGIGRGDSMILALDVPPLANGQGLCDIDKVYFRVTLKKFKKWVALARQN